MTAAAAEGSAGRFGVIGSGWRTDFFLRLARLLPERFEAVGVVTRTAERGSQVEREWSLPTHRSVEALLEVGRPEFVVVSVPRHAASALTVDLVGRGVPVLSETPPAADPQGLRDLWSAVGRSALVQVAEQYLMLPSHAARWSVLRSGTIGTVTSVQVSSTHQYHAVSMIRQLLDAGHAPVAVTARALEAPLADPLDRGGWTGGAEPRPATTTLAVLDFGQGRSGLYDFTDNQWFNPLRTNRIVARGSTGELVDDRVVRLVDPVTAVESALLRRQTGTGSNLEGFDLDHISHGGDVVYRNPYRGARLAEEEIAIATLLDRMTAWCRGQGAAPYPLAEACQDHLVALAIEESARTGTTITTAREAWAS